MLVTDSGCVKLADFGASTTISLGATQETVTIKGTPYFMAPEVLSQGRYGRKGDIWAVGCTMIQMLSGEPPWKDQNLQSLVQLHLLLSTWVGLPPFEAKEELPDDLMSFLNILFERQPDDRPTAREAMQLPFLCDDLDESLEAPSDSASASPPHPMEQSGTMVSLQKQMERAVVRASTKPPPPPSSSSSAYAQGQGQAQSSSSPSPSSSHASVPIYSAETFALAHRPLAVASPPSEMSSSRCSQVYR